MVNERDREREGEKQRERERDSTIWKIQKLTELCMKFEIRIQDIDTILSAVP